MERGVTDIKKGVLQNSRKYGIDKADDNNRNWNYED